VIIEINRLKVPDETFCLDVDRPSPPKPLFSRNPHNVDAGVGEDEGSPVPTYIKISTREVSIYLCCICRSDSAVSKEGLRGVVVAYSNI
jgi:hypothetical protein